MNEASLREFYEFVYPVELVTRWLSYTLVKRPDATITAAAAVVVAKNAGDDDDDNGSSDHKSSLPTPHAMTSAHATDAESDSKTSSYSNSHGMAMTQGEAYLARREFCFTLLGDIFTRFRSYRSASELRAELLRCCPAKIDVGAVYNARPSQRQSVSNVVPVERELVFDLDMSDYDSVRSCCSGKSICVHCWPWMACAARVLHAVLTHDFGFQYLLPVFSGRRGVHVWVCDKRARRLRDDERAAIVGYVSAMSPKEAAAATAALRSSPSTTASPLSRYGVVADLAQHRPVHPTMRHIAATVLLDAFLRLFCGGSSRHHYSNNNNSNNNDDENEDAADEAAAAAANPNNVRYHAKPAALVYATLLRVLQLGRREHLQRFLQHAPPYRDGDVLDWPRVCRALGSEHECAHVLQAVAVVLLYPRLDEHVSTRRDHLLKLPFCVHPATLQLCCPLTWSRLAAFDPTRDAPTLSSLLLARDIDARWCRPLEELLDAMAADPDER